MGKRKKSGKKPANAPLNFVHVHGLAINKGGQHTDAKREAKRGKRKHKADWARTNGLSFYPLFAATFLPNSLPAR